MHNKKKLKSLEKYRQVFVNEDPTALRSKMVRVLKNEESIKSMWTIKGRINCIYEQEGREMRKTIESPDDLFKLGWAEAKIGGLGLYTSV